MTKLPPSDAERRVRSIQRSLSIAFWVLNLALFAFSFAVGTYIAVTWFAGVILVAFVAGALLWIGFSKLMLTHYATFELWLVHRLMR